MPQTMAILYSKDVKMTALLERVITILAPHTCLGCGAEDNNLCDSCADATFEPLLSACVFCAKPSVNWQLCTKCAGKSKLSAVWVAAEYKGVVAELLQYFKFERNKDLYKPLAQAISNALPHLAANTLVVPLPTANTRIRQRGYDQTLLLAKEVARLRGLQVALPLGRISNSRQVGATRKERQAQAKLAYHVTRPAAVKGGHILLVDDICTTGASLNAAARLLHKAGAVRVEAAVVAWQKLG